MAHDMWGLKMHLMITDHDEEGSGNNQVKMVGQVWESCATQWTCVATSAMATDKTLMLLMTLK
jgi:hypothetical protein